jgi:hypothetical protein
VLAGDRVMVGSGLEYQIGQLRRLCPGCAIMTWATGSTDPAGSALILQALWWINRA